MWVVYYGPEHGLDYGNNNSKLTDSHGTRYWLKGLRYARRCTYVHATLLTSASTESGQHRDIPKVLRASENPPCV